MAIGIVPIRNYTLFPSAARTNHASSPDITLQQGERSVRIDIDITAFTGTSITFTWEYFDIAKGAWLTLIASAALSATGHTVLQAHPTMLAAANATAATIIPRRTRLTPSGTITTVTYSVSVTTNP